MTRVRFGRIIMAAALGGSLVATSASTAGAENDPPADLGASLQRTASKILATATAGEPLKVVTTTRTSGAPKITTAVASSRSNALELIASRLAKSSTIGVDMAHPVRIATTNDTYRSRQWALTRFKAETAWKTATGRGVVVAVIDTGVRFSHPDFEGRVLKGYDVLRPGTASSDENGHGTHVAGIIAAMANNRRGIAGLARHARILPVRVLDKNGSGDTAGVAQGIVWAVDHGADVLNLSLSATRSDSATQAAVAYAVSKNVVVVAAAGNSGCGLLGSPRTYPAAYDGVLGVGAITSSGAVSSFSNCGSYVDVVAPGSGIVSTMTRAPAKALGCSANYCTLSGTSMASPYVAAAAALEIQNIGRGWKQASVRAVIESTADDIGSRGRDNRSGTGILNPRRMLSR